MIPIEAAADTFYRFHWTDGPEFGAGNAWSALWGRERSGDGSQTRCGCADEHPDDRADCRICGGTGWEDALRGYSCCRTAADLVAYFASRGEPTDGEVIVFRGQLVGNGCDGEPLAVPTEVVARMTWAELRGTGRELP